MDANDRFSASLANDLQSLPEKENMLGILVKRLVTS